jgi:hypothetical protein
MLGLVGGAGLYAKLLHGIVMLVLAAWLLADVAARRQLRTPWPWLGAALAAAVASPLIRALAENDWQVLSYASARGAAAAGSLAGFPLRVMALAMPMVALLALGAWLVRTWPPADATTARFEPPSARAMEFLLATALGPMLVVMVLAAVKGVGLRSAWASSMVPPLALLVVGYVWHQLDRDALKRVATIALVTAVAVPLGYAAALLRGPKDAGSPTRVNWPERQIAEFFAERWSQATDKPLRIVAGDAWVAGLAGIRNPDRPMILTEGRRELSPWISQQQIARDGLLIVWDVRRGALPDPMRELLTGVKVHEQRFTSRQRGDVILGYAIVPPR